MYLLQQSQGSYQCWWMLSNTYDTHLKVSCELLCDSAAFVVVLWSCSLETSDFQTLRVCCCLNNKNSCQINIIIFSAATSGFGCPNILDLHHKNETDIKIHTWQISSNLKLTFSFFKAGNPNHLCLPADWNYYLQAACDVISIFEGIVASGANITSLTAPQGREE